MRATTTQNRIIVALTTTLFLRPAIIASAFMSTATATATAAAENNKKAHTALDETNTTGEFKRVAASFRDTIEPGGRFEPEAGRYHLYVSLACPWAAGTLAALKYKGLTEAIGHSIVHPTWGRTRPDDPDDEHCGWHFKNPGDDPVPNPDGHGSNECDDALIPDTVNGAKTVRDLYEIANDATGKYSTPLLWCKKEKTIVSNESEDILRIFDTAFDENGVAKHPDRKLFPTDPARAEAASELNEYVYPTVNNGVYRCGFATKQAAYATAHKDLFESLDRLEEHLKAQVAEGHDFLTGSDLTWIDLRLYHTLVRFDPVYVVYFKTSFKRIADYPNLLRFVRRCYAIPEIEESTNIEHIKTHYFTSHPTLNPYGIIPEHDGPSLEME